MGRSKGSCAFDGCAGIVSSGGLCAAHGLQRRKGKKLVAVRPHGNLSERDVIASRAQYKAGGVSISKIARRLGVSVSTMNSAIRGKTFAHLPGAASAADVVAAWDSRRTKHIVKSTSKRGSASAVGFSIDDLPIEVIERFWSRVLKVDGGCWTWQGNCSVTGGYGTLWVHVFRRHIMVHRLSVVISGKGPLADGMSVLHSCDNPPCVNPDHLTVGDHAANMADMGEKGRAFRMPGEANHAAKLTAGQVVSIRARCERGEGRAQVASEYGVSDTMISNIVNGKAWRHVTDGAP